MAVTNTLSKHDKGQGISSEVPDQVIDAAERVQYKAVKTFATFADIVDHHVETDHDALLVKLEWQIELNPD